MEKPSLPKTYSPAEVEDKIYKLWLDSGSFQARPDERGPDKRYVVMMPLPNVTGALHMGHAMDNGMQDLLIRWHRMMGDNTLWMPGTDHAGIATQAVVEKRLKELENLTRHDVGRDGLIERIWRWKDQYQARIIEQQQRMGCSCDWDKQRFTMDKVCARAVRHNFFRMFRDGLIFRGKRLVNWDVFLKTTISDDEMYYETVAGHFWHLKYPVLNPQKGEPAFVVVATTRPETMLGDTAVAVHPDPEAALTACIAKLEQEQGSPEAEAALAQLKERRDTMLPGLIRLRDMARAGRLVNLPLLDRAIPLICDEWAKPELGSGCVKITPAHDYNDYGVWQRHKNEIDIINILNQDGTLTASAGPYAGMERFAARDKVVADLEQLGLLEKIEDRDVEIGHSDRSKTPVEPFLSDQWFVRMGDVEGGIVMGRGTDKEFRSPGLVQSAMDAVLDGRVKIHPERYTKTYLDWLAEKRDWPISRQLWWGHRIPVWCKELAPGALAGEKLFGELARLGREKPGVKKAYAVRIAGLESDVSTFIEYQALDKFTPPPGLAQEACRVDVCLLEEHEELSRLLEGLDYKQDPDVLDTWFSSSLWPFSTLGWPDPATAGIERGQSFLGPQEGLPDCLSYYYPGSCLVTGRDIITLWVARMVLAGLYNLGDIPFSDVFIHATILDGKGVRMSKSKGNGIDPVDIIETYGTDAMRYVLYDMQTGTQDIRLPVTAVCPSCGYHNDLATTRHGANIFCYVCGKNEDGSIRKEGCGAEFDVLGTLPGLPAAKLISERFETGRAFCTKLWNSARFAFMNLEGLEAEQWEYADLKLEDRWILSCLNTAIRDVTAGFRDYNPSYALNAVREFFWSAFCDWYLELIKPRLTIEGGKSGALARQVLAFCLDQVLRLLHPFVPYITEHLWQALAAWAPERGLGSLAPLTVSPYLIQAAWPAPVAAWEEEDVRSVFAFFQEVVRAIREVRAVRNVPPREELAVTIKPHSSWSNALEANAHIIKELARVKSITLDPGAGRTPGSASRIVCECEIFIHDIIDDETEKKRLKVELAQVEKEILASENKLSNPQFTGKAPADIVAKQKEKLEEGRAKREALLLNLKALE